MSYIKSKLHHGRSVRIMKKALIIHIFYILQESKKKIVRLFSRVSTIGICIV